MIFTSISGHCWIIFGQARATVMHATRNGVLPSTLVPAPTNNSSYIGRVISFYFVFVFCCILWIMWLWKNPNNVTHHQLLSIDQVWRRSTALTWSRWGCRRLADNIWLLAHDNNNNNTHVNENKWRETVTSTRRWTHRRHAATIHHCHTLQWHQLWIRKNTQLFPHKIMQLDFFWKPMIGLL